MKSFITMPQEPQTPLDWAPGLNAMLEQGANTLAYYENKIADVKRFF
jgi:hypothetical protein